jgi:hypothetical protein
MRCLGGLARAEPGLCAAAHALAGSDCGPALTTSDRFQRKPLVPIRGRELVAAHALRSPSLDDDEAAAGVFSDRLLLRPPLEGTYESVSSSEHSTGTEDGNDSVRIMLELTREGCSMMLLSTSNTSLFSRLSFLFSDKPLASGSVF